MHIIRKENVLTYINYKPVFNGINVIEFGWETGSTRESLAKPHIHYNHIIHFVLEGEGEFVCENRRHSIKEGQAFVITPTKPVQYNPKPHGKWTYCWISFSGSDCSTLFSQSGIATETEVFAYEQETIAPLLSFLKLIRRGYLNNELTFPMQVMAMSYQLLANISAILRNKEENTEKKSSSIIDTAITYMQNNLHTSLNVSTLCTELGISRAYFSTLFQNTMKTSPYQFLQNLRVQRAGELLLNDPSLRVGEISDMVGYNSTVQFCKAFKKKNGFSPSEFRAHYKHKNP